MSASARDDIITAQAAIEGYLEAVACKGISLSVRRNFDTYAAIRRRHGDHHLNQAFDPQSVQIGDGDFWVLAENDEGEAVSTYCLRIFLVEDFFSLIRSQALWYGNGPIAVDPTFIVDCEIPPFGGHVAHGGGLWIRRDYRGASKLASLMPRFARAVALRNWPVDHDSAMIRNEPCDTSHLADRKATFMGTRTYGFARVHRLVQGWFPPEGRDALIHLCHSTRAEAMASLRVPLSTAGAKPRVFQFPDFARLSARKVGLRVGRLRAAG
jgi:hypothetical protein